MSSLRLNGSVLGRRNVPTATVATGAWNLRAQSLYRRDNIWPRRDPDAVAFAATSGATDVDAISDFVKGVKRLGLWGSMVCWPLRSSQNAGTGTTAFSLGGLGTFNGTLVNEPTWGTNGVTFDGTDDRITTTFSGLAANGARDLFVVAKASNQTLAIIASIHPSIITAGTSAKPWGILQFPNATTWSGWTAVTAPTIGAVTTAAFSSASFGHNGSARYAYINGASASIANETPDTHTPNTLTIGGPGGQNWFYSSEIAFVMLATTSSAPNLHGLYKSTLGTGLGLP